MPNQPTDAPAVMRDLIDRWAADGEPPEEVELENVNGAWTASTAEFLEQMAGPGGDTMPAHTREQVEQITGREIGAYGDAATALLVMLDPDEPSPEPDEFDAELEQLAGEGLEVRIPDPETGELRLVGYIH